MALDRPEGRFRACHAVSTDILLRDMVLSLASRQRGN